MPSGFPSPDPRLPAEAPSLDAGLPAGDADRRQLLQAAAAGRLRLTRAALVALDAEGVEGVARNLKLDAAGAMALCLDDRRLYAAATRWRTADRRGLWRALAAEPVLADRLTGYGLALLAGVDGDADEAWLPMGEWVFARRAGWAALRRRLSLPLREARTLAGLERAAAPWARRFAVLQYLAGELGHGDMHALLRLASERGRPWTRILARGALDEAHRLAARRQAAAAAEAAAAQPAYPELIPLSHFEDVPVATERRPDPPVAAGDD